MGRFQISPSIHTSGTENGSNISHALRTLINAIITHASMLSKLLFPLDTVLCTTPRHNPAPTLPATTKRRCFQNLRSSCVTRSVVRLRGCPPSLPWHIKAIVWGGRELHSKPQPNPQDCFEERRKQRTADNQKSMISIEMEVCMLGW